MRSGRAQDMLNLWIYIRLFYCIFYRKFYCIFYLFFNVQVTKIIGHHLMQLDIIRQPSC